MKRFAPTDDTANTQAAAGDDDNSEDPMKQLNADAAEFVPSSGALAPASVTNTTYDARTWKFGAGWAAATVAGALRWWGS